MSDTPSVSEQTGVPSYEEFLSTRKAKNELGQNDFLALLAAQLQYQDPLEPTKDTDFVAQLAQFSTLSMMENLTNVMTTYQYYSLTGQYVYAEVTLDNGKEAAIEGIVDCVIMKDGEAYAQVGEYVIKCSTISQVINQDSFTNNSLLGSTSLIDKYVAANTYDSEGEGIKVTGKVTGVSIKDGALVATLDSGYTIRVGNIFDVSATEITLPPPSTGGEGEGEGEGEGGGETPPPTGDDGGEGETP